MRGSQLYTPTLREVPAGADAISHRLLVRADYIRQLMAGHYSLLPLAVRARAKIVDIVREEMERIGAQEFILPALHPAEIWQESGRWEVMGEEMFRLRDRRDADLALGMTHEEIITTLAQELASYRDLPQIWYQNLFWGYSRELRWRGQSVTIFPSWTTREQASIGAKAGGWLAPPTAGRGPVGVRTRFARAAWRPFAARRPPTTPGNAVDGPHLTATPAQATSP
jgi:hypothetical protein